MYQTTLGGRRASARVLPLLCLGLATLAPFGWLEAADDGPLLTVHKRFRTERDGQRVEQTEVEGWQTSQTALILCDVWDSHHSANAVRRLDEMAPRMNAVVERARSRGVLIIHAPSGCMSSYEGHPARLRAKNAPSAANLPPDIGAWLDRIPSEERGRYPLDQSDGGGDDDPAELREWQGKLLKAGRDPKSPWKKEHPAIRIDDSDAISDSGAEIWNVMEQAKIRNVILMGVHTNMCVLGRPFGLRQMARNRKNVVLVRDLTDTMYNPQRWPYVTHFAGTDRIIEHIESFVCPTITSVDLAGGVPFRFGADRRSILILISEPEYRTNETLPEYARQELVPRGFQVTIIEGDSANPNEFPGLEKALPAADLVLLSLRRRTLPAGQLDAIKAFLAAGKPLVGIRTASHSFALRAGEAAPPGTQTWQEFDPEILGGHYVGHWGAGPKASLTPAEGAVGHVALTGIDFARLIGNGSLYRVLPLEPSAVPLVIGTVPEHPPEPVAWTNIAKAGGSRVFYTSLGHPDDFQEPMFRRLLLNGISWALQIAPPGAPE